MTDKRPVPTEPETIACEVCLAEIPSSVAKNDEAAGYVHHFCGTECYDQWKRQAEQTPLKK